MGSVLCHYKDEEDIVMAATVVVRDNGQDDEQWESSIASAISRLKELEINFLAIDFDQTMIDMHTGGRWTGSLEELVSHVRPYFPAFLKSALREDISVAIVTFSPQVDFIRALLEQVLGREVSHKIPIRAGGQFLYQGVGIREGKQAHMASAVEELEGHGVEITKQTTLLIDDDVKNIRTALRDGVRAIWLNPRQSHVLLQDITKLV